MLAGLEHLQGFLIIITRALLAAICLFGTGSAGYCFFFCWLQGRRDSAKYGTECFSIDTLVICGQQI